MNVSVKDDVCDSRHVASSETQQESQVLERFYIVMWIMDNENQSTVYLLLISAWHQVENTDMGVTFTTTIM